MFVVEGSDRAAFLMNAFNKKAMKISVFYFASRFIIYHVKFVKKSHEAAKRIQSSSSCHPFSTLAQFAMLAKTDA